MVKFEIARIVEDSVTALAARAVLGEQEVTGTRAGDMSRLIYSHRALVKAGVDARMVLWDGVDGFLCWISHPFLNTRLQAVYISPVILWHLSFIHCFMSEGELPESREAVEIAIKFFADAMDKPTP